MFQRKPKSPSQEPQIGPPTSVSHAVHVDTDFNWSGPEAANQFELKEKLGEGSYGIVYRASHIASGISVAVKVLPVDLSSTTSTLTAAAADENENENENQGLNAVKHEIEILKGCRSPNIVAYLGCFKLNADDFWIIMDFCDIGSVRDLLDALESPLKEKQIATILYQSLNGLAYLHNKGIIHRDVKAGNILMDSRGSVKIADFGVSKQMMGSWKSTITQIGTPLWMAPEVIQKQPYTFTADIWSLGVTAIEMADLWPPYADMSPIRAMLVINRNPPPTLKNARNWSSEFVHFIEICCNKTANRRPSANDLLRHPFVSNAGKGEETLKDLISFGIKMQKRQKQLQAAIEQEKQKSPRTKTTTTTTTVIPPPNSTSTNSIVTGTVVLHSDTNSAMESISGTVVHHESPQKEHQPQTIVEQNSSSDTVVVKRPQRAKNSPPKLGSVIGTATLRSAVKGIFPKTPRDAATVSPLTTMANALAQQAESVNITPRDVGMMFIGALIWTILWPIIKFIFF